MITGPGAVVSGGSGSSLSTLEAVSALFVMDPYLTRYEVGADAIADGSVDRAVRAMRGDAGPDVFIPGTAYTVVDLKQGIIQFGRERSPRDGKYVKQPVEKQRKYLRVWNLPEPKRADAYLQLKNEYDLNRSEIRNGLLALFSALAASGAALEHVIPPGARAIAKAKNYFESSVIARLLGKSTAFEFRIPLRFERGRSETVQVDIEGAEFPFVLVLHPDFPLIELSIELLHEGDRNNSQGHDLLDEGLRLFLKRFACGSGQSAPLSIWERRPDEVAVGVSPDIAAPDSMDSLQIGADYIFTGEIQ